MSAIEGFYSTWRNARTTYGQGTPQTGERYDNSATLNKLGTDLESAAPGSRWTGAASEAYARANTEHREVFTQLADLDKRLATEVDNSAQVVDAGRRDLDAIRQWVQAAAASVPPGKAGDQIRMAIAQKGLARLQEIVLQSNSESDAIAGRIQALDAQFRALGNQRFSTKGSGEEDLQAAGRIPERPPYAELVRRLRQGASGHT